MAPKGGDAFGSFNNRTDYKPAEIKPITTEFSKGSVPNSIDAMDRDWETI